MQIQPTERFGKMLLKLPQNIQRETLNAIENVLNATSFSDIHHLKSLKGYPNYYRIRVGQYRMGIYWDGVRFIAEKNCDKRRFLQRVSTKISPDVQNCSFKTNITPSVMRFFSRL